MNYIIYILIIDLICIFLFEIAFISLYRENRSLKTEYIILETERDKLKEEIELYKILQKNENQRKGENQK